MVVLTESIALHPEGSRGYFARAIALRRRGEYAAALDDAHAAVRFDPESDASLNLRAALHYQLGNYREAVDDHVRAHELDPDNPGTLNFLGWIRATCPDDQVRDAKQALRDATRACELTHYGLPGYLDTLAAAYAEGGLFEDAVRWQEKALEFPEFAKTQGDAARKRIDLYRKGQPYHQPPKT